jgi:acetyl-CoA acetyltransferase
VNPTGGARELGHPIGASGVIYFGEMVHHLGKVAHPKEFKIIVNPSAYHYLWGSSRQKNFKLDRD